MIKQAFDVVLQAEQLASDLYEYAGADVPALPPVHPRWEKARLFSSPFFLALLPSPLQLSLAIVLHASLGPCKVCMHGAHEALPPRFCCCLHGQVTRK